MGRRSLVLFLFLFFMASCVLADSFKVPSADIIPRGSWIYDILMDLAGDGLLKDYSARLFEGERLFNRLEVAAILAQAIGDGIQERANELQLLGISRLIGEFRPELSTFHDEALENWETNTSEIHTGRVLTSGYVRVSVTQDNDNDGSLSVPYKVALLANVSQEAFAAVAASDKEDKFLLVRREFPIVGTAFVRGYGQNSIWEVGRDYYRFGPCYGGSLILSDNSPSFWGISESRELDLGPFLGRVKVTQLASTFEDGGERLYLFARRYQRPLTHGWFLGISESVKTTEMPNPLILVMPYYLYQHLFNEVDEEFNVLYSADILYNGRPGYEFYAELLIDDITSPRLFGSGFERPRKTGLTVGVYLPRFIRGSRLSTFRGEYTYVDRLTYSATRTNFPQLAYTHDGDIIGHPLGWNTKALYLRSEHYFTSKLSLVTEYLDQKEVEARDPRQAERRTLSFLLSCDYLPDKSVGVRIAPYRTVFPDGRKRSSTFFELRFSAQF